MNEANQKQLGNTLWSIADQLRGAMNADGCVSSASNSARACISGPLTGGGFRQANPPSPRSIPRSGATPTPAPTVPGDQHDAFSIAAWLSQANRDGSLAGFLQPELAPHERVIAQVEGWILGVGGASTQWGNLATAEVKGHA